MANRSAAMQVRAYATRGSHVLHTVSNVARVEDVSHFSQRSYNVADRSGPLPAVSDTGMVRSGGKLLAQKISIVRKKHTSLRQGKLEVFLVGCFDEVRVR